MNLDELALKVAEEVYGAPIAPMAQEQFIEFAHRLVAELVKQEPDWVTLQKEAEHIIKDKPTYKRFIDGTPLSNDISCWMADFAMEHGIYQPVEPAAPIIPAGWVMVPKEPTERQWEEGKIMLSAMLECKTSIDLGLIYKAMLAAVPKGE